MSASDEVPTLYSGGAEGADLLFEELAIENGHRVRAMSFNGHSTESEHRIVLKEPSLERVKPRVKEAGQILGRVANYKPYTYNLLCRNYYQIHVSQCVYAIGNLESSNGNKLCVNISGGTAWAVQMYVLKQGRLENYGVLPLFFYNMTDNQWYRGVLAPDAFEWRKVDSEVVPAPAGVYTGIGSRELTKKGIKAIRKLY